MDTIFGVARLSPLCFAGRRLIHRDGKRAVADCGACTVGISPTTGADCGACTVGISPTTGADCRVSTVGISPTTAETLEAGEERTTDKRNHGTRSGLNQRV
ncbi:hypothetical protein PAMP_011411 [Pampus punctatissimus]